MSSQSSALRSVPRSRPRQSAAASSHPPPPEWPRLADEAFYGLAGRYIRMIEPHTEADPAGILVQFLVMFGNVIGRGPHFKVEADEHHLNLFAVLVGETSKGRKGVSAGQAKRLFPELDSKWVQKQGLSSGEGLIWAVRDPIEREEPTRDAKGKATGEFETVVIDEGVVDKRLMILEGEFSSTLKIMKRESNILSAIVRNAWDTGDLRILTKNSPGVATGAHISIIGHISRTELTRYLDTTEAANGFGNRFLWTCVRRSKMLPEGGTAHTLDFRPIIEELKACVEYAREAGEIRRDDEARAAWAEVYPALSEGKPGLLGSMIARAEAQVMRLACVYALLDRSCIVQHKHLLAALALWTYCENSARWIFGEALGDPVADGLLQMLRSEPSGLTRTQIRDLHGRHKGQQVDRALALLLQQGLVSFEKESTGGRPSERWKAR